MAPDFRKWRGLGDRLWELYDQMEQTGIVRWPVQAASLAYYCILGLVPFLALCFAIAKSFGLEAALGEAINSYFATFAGQDEILLKLKALADNLISNYSGSVLVFVALGLIFWSGYRILALLETIFGLIFGYHPPRRFTNRLLDYFTVMVVVPLVLVAGAAVNIYVMGLAKATWAIPWGINPSGVFSAFVVISPYLMWWFVLSWAYAYFSRGLARWRERLLGGFITGLFFQLFQNVYIKIMFDLTSYNAIYGGFAAIPLFMIWLNCSWVIVLAGGELTRRFSDLLATGRGFFSFPVPATWRNTSAWCRLVMAEIVKNYTAGPDGRATSFRQLSRSLGAPMPTLGGVINRLLAADLLVRIAGPTSEEGPSFLPARSPEQLTDEYLKEALETGTMEIL